MEQAESRTFRQLKATHTDIWRPAIEAGGGLLVGTAGDAILAEFNSAVAAVSVAIDIQERMVRFNTGLDDSQRLMFRIGVHMGEVIVDQDDQNIFGDGVNVAARIQAVAEPGGVAVSGAVREIADLRVDYGFVDGGEHTFKNVSRPVRVFHLRTSMFSQQTVVHMMQAKLRFEGADSTRQFFSFEVVTSKLPDEGLVVGRAPDQCPLVVQHATVSRRHARLTRAGVTLQIEDLGSTNGTAVDGKALNAGAPVPVKVGSTIRLGDVTLAIVQV
ncbi:hypothetical protein BH10PSE6_BH10PSE6_38040 [soil metagenome]